jgi:hypothetical protein
MSKQSDTQIHVNVPSYVIDTPQGVPAVLVPNTANGKTSHTNNGKTITATLGSTVIVNPS